MRSSIPYSEWFGAVQEVSLYCCLVLLAVALSNLAQVRPPAEGAGHRSGLGWGQRGKMLCAAGRGSSHRLG